MRVSNAVTTAEVDKRLGTTNAFVQIPRRLFRVESSRVIILSEEAFEATRSSSLIFFSFHSPCTNFPKNLGRRGLGYDVLARDKKYTHTTI